MIWSYGAGNFGNFGYKYMNFSLPYFDLPAFITSTFAEDLGDPSYGGGHDVTSESVIPADALFTGVMDARHECVVAGLPIAEAFFRHLDAGVEVEILAAEGELVPAGTDLMRLRGKGRAMLTAERSALNTVQHLTGIATMTRAYVRQIEGTGCTLLDTRKTIPGLRHLENMRRVWAAHKITVWGFGMRR